MDKPNLKSVCSRFSFWTLKDVKRGQNFLKGVGSSFFAITGFLPFERKTFHFRCKRNKKRKKLVAEAAAKQKKNNKKEMIKENVAWILATAERRCETWWKGWWVKKNFNGTQGRFWSWTESSFSPVAFQKTNAEDTQKFVDTRAQISEIYQVRIITPNRIGKE